MTSSHPPSNLKRSHDDSGTCVRGSSGDVMVDVEGDQVMDESDDEVKEERSEKRKKVNMGESMEIAKNRLECHHGHVTPQLKRHR